jgi:hypothetical protein
VAAHVPIREQFQERVRDIVAVDAAEQAVVDEDVCAGAHRPSLAQPGASVGAGWLRQPLAEGPSAESVVWSGTTFARSDV